MGVFDFLSNATDAAESGVQSAESAATQVPILGTALRGAGTILTGSNDFSQLPVSDQLARTFLTLVISRHPENLPPLLSAYQTQDARTAIERQVGMTSDSFQADWRKVVDANPKLDQRTLWRQQMWNLYPSMRGYYPPRDNGTGELVLPPTRSQTVAAEVRRGIADAPQGYEAEPSTRINNKGEVQASVSYKKPQATADSYPESYVLNNPYLRSQIAAGDATFVQHDEHSGEAWGHVEPTEQGKVKAASALKYGTEQAGELAQESPLPGVGQSPNALKQQRTVDVQVQKEERKRAADLEAAKVALDQLQAMATRAGALIPQSQSTLGGALKENILQTMKLHGPSSYEAVEAAQALKQLGPEVSTRLSRMFAQGGLRVTQTEIQWVTQGLANPNLALPEFLRRIDVARKILADEPRSDADVATIEHDMGAPINPDAANSGAQLEQLQATLRRRKKSQP